MKVFLDTNILLDVLLARTPFLARSAEVLNLCAASAVAGYASVLSFTTIAYVLRKGHTPEQTRGHLNSLCAIVTPVGCSANILKHALSASLPDFEDAIQLYCAKTCDADYLVTRNAKDFTEADLAVVTPEEFLALHAIR